MRRHSADDHRHRDYPSGVATPLVREPTPHRSYGVDPRGEALRLHRRGAARCGRAPANCSGHFSGPQDAGHCRDLICSVNQEPPKPGPIHPPTLKELVASGSVKLPPGTSARTTRKARGEERAPGVAAETWLGVGRAGLCGLMNRLAGQVRSPTRLWGSSSAPNPHLAVRTVAQPKRAAWVHTIRLLGMRIVFICADVLLSASDRIDYDERRKDSYGRPLSCVAQMRRGRVDCQIVPGEE